MQCVLSTMEETGQLHSALLSSTASQEFSQEGQANCSLPYPDTSDHSSADDENAELDNDPDLSVYNARKVNVGVTRLMQASEDKDEMRETKDHKQGSVGQSSQGEPPEEDTEDDGWRVEGTGWLGDLGRSVDLPFPGHHKHRHLLIGVLTQPYYNWNMTKPDEEHTGLDKSFIAVSVVRMLEAGGAQVVPVFHDSTDEEFEKASSSILYLISISLKNLACAAQ
jgi:hypothetical protein